MRNISSKKGLRILNTFCVINVLAAIIVITIHFQSAQPEKEDGLNHLARCDINYTVNYVENSIFPDDLPANLAYLMSFIEDIEVENRLGLEFAFPVNLSYSYSYKETLVIKLIRSFDRNNRPVVFEETFFSEDKIETITTETFAKSETYRINPHEYIEIYWNFINEQFVQMQRRDVSVERPLNFAAELKLEFTYQIRSPEIGVNQTVVRAVIIPLSSEVFNVELTGLPVLELGNRITDTRRLSLPMVIFLSIWFVTGISGFFYSLNKLVSEPDLYKRELKRILKKYADEIIICEKPADLSVYQLINLSQFSELLKFALTLGIVILCLPGDEETVFYTISEGCVYQYTLTKD